MVRRAPVLLWQEVHYHGKWVGLTPGERHHNIVQCCNGDDGEENPVEERVDCDIHDVLTFTLVKQKSDPH